MLPFAIQVGIGAIEYWSMSYGEIADTIEAFKVMDIRRVKEKAAMDYNLANLIGTSCTRLINSEAKFPSLKQAYPTIFVDEEEPNEGMQDWEIAKERLMQYADAQNKKIKEGDVK